MDNTLLHQKPTSFKELGSEKINSLDELLMLSSYMNKDKKSVVDQAKRNNNLRAKGKLNKAQKKKVENIKGQWSFEEDRVLADLVKQHGERGWSQIAEMVPGRVGKQCRERWQNHLRPDIKKGGWSEEEDKLLIALHQEVGNKWSEIAKRMPWRSENTIKNHFNSTKRRQPFPRTNHNRNSKQNNILQNYIMTNLPFSSPSSSSSSSNSKEEKTSSIETFNILDDLMIAQTAGSSTLESKHVEKNNSIIEQGSSGFDTSHGEHSVSSLLSEGNSTPFGNWAFDDQQYYHQMPLPYDLSMALMELEMRNENEFMATTFQDFVTPF